MVELTPIHVIKCDDLTQLNDKLWIQILVNGNRFVFGDETETKNATEIFAVLQLYGKALDDLYKGKVPNGWLFKGNAVEDYKAMLKNPDKGDQPYTYGQRLHAYPVDSRDVANQLEYSLVELHESIVSGIQSNRICGVLWHPIDAGIKSPPCFNWYQLRKLDDNNVSLRLLFRSNDAGNGYAANLVGITTLFVDEVIRPAGGKLAEVILVATSEHVYDNDLDMVYGRLPGLETLPFALR